MSKTLRLIVPLNEAAKRQPKALKPLQPKAPRKLKAKEGAFTKTFKGEWPDKKKDKLDWKDGVATAGYTGVGAAAGAATGAVVGFNPVAGAVLGAGNYLLSKVRQWRKNRSG